MPAWALAGRVSVPFGKPFVVLNLGCRRQRAGCDVICAAPETPEPSGDHGREVLLSGRWGISTVRGPGREQALVVHGRESETGCVGSLYLGAVERLAPQMAAVFVVLEKGVGGRAPAKGFLQVTASRQKRVRVGDRVLVQVVQEKPPPKAPLLSEQIRLEGMYVVLWPMDVGLSLPPKVTGEARRNLQEVFAPFAGVGGVLLRPEAVDAPVNLVLQDLERLRRRWDSLCGRLLGAQAPSLLWAADLDLEVAIDAARRPGHTHVLVDSVPRAQLLRRHLEVASLATGGGTDHVAVSVVQRFSPETTRAVALLLRLSLQRTVALPCGGYIMIEPTEAFVAVDVNSGNCRDLMQVNREAAVEVARQLRVRNLAGMIVVDFIEMEARQEQLLLLRVFSAALKEDDAQTSIVQLSELGLVQVTRERRGLSLADAWQASQLAGGRAGPGGGGRRGASVAPRLMLPEEGS